MNEARNRKLYKVYILMQQENLFDNMAEVGDMS